MSVIKIALQSYRATDAPYITVQKGNSVLVSKNSIENGYADGFNQSSGRTGKVPLYVFHPPVVALDIGTSYARIGVEVDGEFKNVDFNGEGPKMCRVAINGGSVKGFMRFLKQVLTTDEHFSLVKMEVVKASGVIGFRSTSDDKVIPISEIARLMLIELKRQTDEALECSSTRCIFIVPYTCSYYQTLMLRNAALMSGYMETSTIFQNQSLALAHCKMNGTKSKVFLVVSIGAAHCDLSIFEKKGDTLNTLSMDGSDFGGSDLTRQIFDRIKGEHQYTVFSASSDRHLYSECERAKVNLNTLSSYQIPIPGHDVPFLLTPEILDQISAPLRGRIERSIEKILSKASISNVDQVLVSGGAVGMMIKYLERYGSVIVLPATKCVEGATLSKSPTNFHLKARSSRCFTYGIGLANGTIFPMILPFESFPQTYYFTPKTQITSILLYEGHYIATGWNSLIFECRIDSLVFATESVLKVTLDQDSQGVLRMLISDSARPEIIQSVLVNQSRQIELLKPAKKDFLVDHWPMKGDRETVFRRQYAPLAVGLDDSSRYYNTLLELMTLELVFSDECKSHMKKQVALHSRLLKAFNATQERLDLARKSPLFDISQVLKDVGNVIDSMRDFAVTAEKQIKDTRWSDCKKILARLVSQMDGMATSDLDSSRVDRKGLITACQSYLEYMDCVELILTSNAASLPHVKASYWATLESLVSTYKAQKLPSQLTQLLRFQLDPHLLALSSWSQQPISEELPRDLPGSPTADEIKSYVALRRLNMELQIHIDLHHKSIRDTNIVVIDKRIPPQENKALFQHEEYLLKCLIKLDAIDTKELRSTRKQLVAYCQIHLDQLDILKALHRSLY